MLPSFSLKNKVCVVTGGAGGLGLEFCRAFLQAGCTSIAIIDLKQNEARDAANELMAHAKGTGDFEPQNLKIIGIGCDVSVETDVQTAFTKIWEEFGRIDAVVASAGIVHNYPALDYPTDQIKRLFDVNVHGVFFTAREAARRMIPQTGGGSIILIASMSANIVNVPQFQTPYNSSKAAVKHMAASLAVEWAKLGVRVNALSPGYMLTKLTRSVLGSDERLKETWESLTPLGRLGEPEDLAGAIVFLASNASAFMTGSELVIDGGYSAV